jgi:tripartite ATP-independent transporter DctP family solute receptor
MTSGQLGRENDTIDLARYGVIDMTRVYIGAVNNAVPESQILALPYVFESTQHMRHEIDGRLGALVLSAMEQRGLIGLALYDAGPRCFYNSHRPIQTPDDLIGLKLRVPVSDIFIDLIRALGGNPTPLGYGDTYSALQTHLIDGAENNWSSFQSSRHYEVAKYWSQSEHSFAPDILLMSVRSFNSLSSDFRELVKHAARESVTFMRNLWDTEEQLARQKAIAAGVHITETNRDAFRKASQPVIKKYLSSRALQPLLGALNAAESLP